jgi:hypothetical protein
LKKARESEHSPIAKLLAKLLNLHLAASWFAENTLVMPSFKGDARATEVKIKGKIPKAFRISFIWNIQFNSNSSKN